MAQRRAITVLTAAVLSPVRKAQSIIASGTPVSTIVANLDTGDIWQVLLGILREASDPLDAACAQLFQIRGHAVEEIVRVSAGGMDTYLGMHLAGAVGMLGQGLFHSSDHVLRLEFELDDVFLGQEADFQRFHIFVAYPSMRRHRQQRLDCYSKDGF